MTPEQIRLVRNSFAALAGVKDEVARVFYERLFELEPDLRPLFSSDPQAQRTKLMAALATVVGALDRLEELLPTVRALGRRHAGYGAQPEHYASVGAALIWTLERTLGPAFTREMRRAWTEAYAWLAWTMVAAAEAERREQRAA